MTTLDRAHQVLKQFGFSFDDAVRMSDEDLLGLQGFGPAMLAAVRAAQESGPSGSPDESGISIGGSVAPMDVVGQDGASGSVPQPKLAEDLLIMGFWSGIPQYRIRGIDGFETLDREVALKRAERLLLRIR